MKWLERIRERNSRPIDTPYTYVYTLGELPLPQPWRQGDTEGVYFVPTEFVIVFADRERLALLRKSEPDQLTALEASLMTEGLKTPLEVYMDPNGKLRMQEGHHRLCVVMEHLESFPKLPIRFRESDNRIKSYGRPITSEFRTILEIIERRTN